MIASILSRIFSPMGSLFALGLSIFGVFFLSLLAILITHDYPYAGEWFESKSTDPSEPVAPLEEQRIETVHSLWMAVGLYLAIAAASGAAVCVHRVRGVL